MPKLIDLTGKKVGQLTIIGRANQIRKNGSFWDCVCDCGNRLTVISGNLKSGHTVSCGCARIGCKLLDLTGKKFGRLTVVERAPQIKRGNARWLCQCECGKNHIVVGSRLVNGSCKSCGCSTKSYISKANTKHGMSSHRINNIWHGIKQRCTNPNTKFYLHYGGRGITLCDQWQTFEGFYNDMGATYYEGATIERNDVDGDYCPNNCKWIDMSMQSRNRTNVPLYEYNGAKLTLGEISEATGLHIACLRSRIFKLKWPLEDAFNTPSLKPTEYHLHKFR